MGPQYGNCFTSPSWRLKFRHVSCAPLAYSVTLTVPAAWFRCTDCRTWRVRESNTPRSICRCDRVNLDISTGVACQCTVAPSLLLHPARYSTNVLRRLNQYDTHRNPIRTGGLVREDNTAMELKSDVLVTLIECHLWF